MIISNVCQHCGHQWTTDTLHERRCPNCDYYFTAASYIEDDNAIEGIHYAEILNNIKQGKSYQVQCTDCGAQAKMYLKEAECHCGGRYTLEAEPAPSPEDLKAIRKELGYSQSSMGALLKVSQGFYSQLESGRRSLSDVPTVAKRLSVISAHATIPRSNSEIVEMR